ncbi:MAG: hypothetical protein OET18_01530 [Desulfobacterales bacterium]|jgi:capsid portal protein|nr:hypothetical protein [Desulfobacterales bacterium]
MEENNNLYSIKGSQFQAIELPAIKEVRGKDYMSFGADNLFPQLLIDLYDNSAMHHTCVDAIKEGILGEGLETIGDEYINTAGESIDEILEKITLDYALYQGYSINVIWNKEGTGIAEIYHLPFANVRSGKRDEEDKVNEYMYSSNWANLRKYPFETYKCFDATDNKGDNASQVYYCFNYTPGNEVYPLPGYVGALNDINLDHRISVFHNSNISQNLMPSMIIKMNNGIPTPEAQREIYREIQNTFSSESNAGKFFLTFSDGSERAMDVQTIDASNDDYYITLEQRISSRILTSHRITSPLLLGIKDASGFSNNADEIAVAYAHFEGTVIEPKRKKILSSFGYILKLAGYNVKMKIKPNRLLSMSDVSDAPGDINQDAPNTRDADVYPDEI